jgi:hypothetical protein
MHNYVIALLLVLASSSAAFAQSPDYIPWHWDDVAADAANSETEDDDEAGELGW